MQWQPCSYSHCFVLLFVSIILCAETPTCLSPCLERLLVSFCLPGLSSCPTQMDRTIRSCLLPSVTTKASRQTSVPSGPNTCLFWARLQVSDSVLGVSTLPKIPAGCVTSCLIQIFILIFIFWKLLHILITLSLSGKFLSKNSDGENKPSEAPKPAPLSDFSSLVTQTEPKSEKDAYS